MIKRQFEIECVAAFFLAAMVFSGCATADPNAIIRQHRGERRKRDFDLPESKVRDIILHMNAVGDLEKVPKAERDYSFEGRYFVHPLSDVEDSIVAYYGSDNNQDKQCRFYLQGQGSRTGLEVVCYENNLLRVLETQGEDTYMSYIQAAVDKAVVDRKRRADDEAFNKSIQDAQAGKVPSELPENVRKLAVQAKYLVDQKQFKEAADLYGQALDAAPWWPQGHFDQALILSKVNRYDDAISEMKRYLKLSPNAPDARQVQDKIYQWEIAAKTNPAPESAQMQDQNTSKTTAGGLMVDESAPSKETAPSAPNAPEEGGGGMFQTK